MKHGLSTEVCWGMQMKVLTKLNKFKLNYRHVNKQAQLWRQRADPPLKWTHLAATTSPGWMNLQTNSGDWRKAWRETARSWPASNQTGSTQETFHRLIVGCNRFTKVKCLANKTGLIDCCLLHPGKRKAQYNIITTYYRLHLSEFKSNLCHTAWLLFSTRLVMVMLKIVQDSFFSSVVDVNNYHSSDNEKGIKTWKRLFNYRVRPHTKHKFLNCDSFQRKLRW